MLRVYLIEYDWIDWIRLNMTEYPISCSSFSAPSTAHAEQVDPDSLVGLHEQKWKEIS
jgi:hypothetical protein